jgi:hypothetical protein
MCIDKVRGLAACLTKQLQDFKAGGSKILYLNQRSPPILNVSLSFIGKWKTQFEDRGIPRLKLSYQGTSWKIWV